MRAGGESSDRLVSLDLLAYSPTETFARISDYFEAASRAMLDQREAKRRLFINPSDIGKAVEGIYREFLIHHVPAVCDLLQGGYVFDVEGLRSHQMDIIVHSGNTHRFKDSDGQACATLEGTIADVEITSYLDSSKIDDELKKFAFIPPTKEFRGIGNRQIINDTDHYREWWLDIPLKVLIAFDGLDSKAALDQINSFYTINDHIPIARRVNVLHMLNRYCVIKSDFDVHPDTHAWQLGEYSVVGSGRVDTLATTLILTRISQNHHLVTRNAYTSNDLRRNIMRNLG